MRFFRWLLRNGRSKIAQRDKETANIINSFSNMEDRMSRRPNVKLKFLNERMVELRDSKVFKKMGENYSEFMKEMIP